MNYTPTLHAIERAHHRLGVEPTQSKRWFNDIMRKASFLFTQKSGRNTQAIYETDEVRLIVDTDNKTVVTIYPKLDTSILKPVFEREERRIKREVTRNIRRHELAIAELTVDKGNRMIAYARARNPQTRELIQRGIDDIVTQIEGINAAITLEKDRLENFVRATGVYV